MFSTLCATSASLYEDRQVLGVILARRADFFTFASQHSIHHRAPSFRLDCGGHVKAVSSIGFVAARQVRIDAIDQVF
jgi:hypothetical protein